jgi:hypothetical protein
VTPAAAHLRHQAVVELLLVHAWVRKLRALAPARARKRMRTMWTHRFERRCAALRQQPVRHSAPLLRLGEPDNTPVASFPPLGGARRAGASAAIGLYDPFPLACPPSALAKPSSAKDEQIEARTNSRRHRRVGRGCREA